jgi:hypothetical protein
VFDPRRRHVTPADDIAARLCLPAAELPGEPGRAEPTATVTPIGSRLGGQAAEQDPRREAGQAPAPRPGAPQLARQPLTPQPRAEQPSPAAQDQGPASGLAPGGAAAGQAPRGRPAKKAAGGRPRRSSVPSWDEIMLGTSRHSE